MAAGSAGGRRPMIVQHFAGEPIGDRQSCTRCGAELINFEKAMAPIGQGGPVFWRIGTLYEEGHMMYQPYDLIDLLPGDGIVACQKVAVA